MESLTGRTLKGQYYLREKVGSGGMADVYLSWDKIRSVRLAIKILLRDLSNNEKFFHQFTKEAEILTELNHPNIVRFYEFAKEGDIVFIVMDWVDGSDLKEVIRKSKQVLSLEVVSRIFESICPALHYAHENKIYHCDIKPANIMIHKDGRVQLTDFGVALLANENAGTGRGTPPYMAPEQFISGIIDARTDVYALGITLFEILSGGKKPYQGLSITSEGSTTEERIQWEHLNLPPPKLSLYNPRATPTMEMVIATAILKEPARRFPSVLDLLAAFDKAKISMSDAPSHSSQSILKNLTSLANSTVSIASAATEAATRYVKDSGIAEWSHNINSSVQKSSRNIRGKASDKKNPKKSLIGRSRGAFLVSRSGQLAGKTISIQIGETSIGRGSHCQIKLSDNTVSRSHATLVHTKRGVYVRDNGSTIGTFVNGNRIFGLTLLNDRDILQIGNWQVFEYHQP